MYFYFFQCIIVAIKNYVEMFVTLFLDIYVHCISFIGLWCLTPLSTIIQLHVYRGGVPGENHRPVASHRQT